MSTEAVDREINGAYSRQTVSALFKRGQNNFDLIRLLAAIGVMFGHSFLIQPAHGRHEPIARLTGLEYSGSLSVYAFFLVSGMLVTDSFVRQRSVLRFAAHRVARIFPGLVACVLITAYVLYPALSNLSLLDAIRSDDAARYVIRNITFYPDIVYTLPHIFDTAPFKNSVNGSLWTIPIELKCYLIVVVAGIIGVLRSRLAALAFLSLCIACLWWMILKGAPYDFLRSYVTKPADYSFYPVAFFLIGMLLYSLREHVIVDVRFWVVVACCYVLLAHSVVGPVLFYGMFVYGILCFASARRFFAVSPKNDFSYGVYLWAFPVQQFVASAYPKMDNLLGLVLSIPMALMLAALSWHFVERPCIAYCRRLMARD
ncbi:acyltransferase family protein [Burkholderia sp. YIM B11467]